MSDAMNHRIDQPRPGTFKIRVKSGGAWVPARIWAEPAREPVTHAVADRAPTLRCIVDGKERDVTLMWTWLHDISEAEYERLCDETADVDHGKGLMDHHVRLAP